MKRAEQVTFGGSGLDRAAHLRTDPDALDALWHAEGERAALVLLFWRGKPLCLRPEAAGSAEGLAPVAATHNLVAGQRDQALFLGCTETGAGYFAVDISDWDPEDTDLSTLNTFLDPSEQRHPDLPDACVFSELRRVMTLLTPREAELATTAKAMLSWHDSHRFCARCGDPSRIEQAGWQRRCDSCSGAHFPRTDPVVIMLITRGDRVLLGRSPGWPDGMYSLLAGFVEPGETMEAAVRREVLEEAGIRVGPVAYLASQPWAFPMSLMLGCHGQALNDEIRIDPAEIEEAFWLSRQEVMDVFAGQHPKVQPPRKGAIAGFLLENWVADTLG
ncbi:NAD(+) diphosphatase [Phaeobacter sp. B1627]|uniref:NAD(+) diphosphatase n=1 Tax=Phaeobacter sp. B1627 TaxID=2583809 RepID=UPI00111A2FF0|nr:NAD(+) diphosphatase [Phaeobacter sp. B1627]TNJ47573.1 NAD(+) diphosphatase [Phaeobacter sp. B1627]